MDMKDPWDKTSVLFPIIILFRANAIVGSAELLTCVREISSSNLGRNVEYLE
jgi:hypothetical protein